MKKALRVRDRSFILSVLILISSAISSFAYYHPDEGRWISRDPIGEVDGHNLYLMCKNNAINSHDLLGLAAISVKVSYVGHSLGIPFHTMPNITAKCECFNLRLTREYSLTCVITAYPQVNYIRWEDYPRLDEAPLGMTWDVLIRHEFARVGQIIDFVYGPGQEALAKYETEYCPESACSQAKANALKTFNNAFDRFMRRWHLPYGSDEENRAYNIYVEWLRTTDR